MISLKHLINNQESKNAFWIMAGKASQMAVSFIITIWTGRYLGPSNYGLISYVSAYLAFFTAFCTLGITSAVLINELTEKPDEEGLTLGTTMVLRIISSTLSAIMVVLIVAVVDCDEPITIWVAVLSSFSLICQGLDTLEYWFQKRYLSKVTAISSLIGCIIAMLYKVFLLITGKNVLYFAIATSVDYIAIAICLYLTYKKYSGPRLRFSWQRGKEILSKSYHFILSGMMVAIYGQTDKVMLKQMLSESEVGYYTVASSLSTVWAFVLSAIITSLAPTIIKYKKDGMKEAFERKNKQLYSLIIYISFFVSSLYTVLSPWIIQLLYGETYYNSIQPLRVITWYVAFAYLGVARDIWMVCENKQKYSKYMYSLAVILNIGLNYVLIPICGATGAALASLTTQIFTSIILPLLWKDMRPNVWLIMKALNPKTAFELIKDRRI